MNLSTHFTQVFLLYYGILAILYHSCIFILSHFDCIIYLQIALGLSIGV